MKVNLFLLLCLLASLSSFGQYKAGTIITNDNETIKGLILPASEEAYNKECRFKKTANANTIIYKPDEIKGFTITNSACYISAKLPFKGKTFAAFLEVVADGIVDIFSYQAGDDNYLFMRKNDGKIEWLSDESKSESSRSIEILKEAFGEVPSVANKVTAKSINKKSLVSLNQLYQSKTSDVELIVYGNLGEQKPNTYGITTGYGVTHLRQMKGNIPMDYKYLKDFPAINSLSKLYLGAYKLHELRGLGKKGFIQSQLSGGHINYLSENISKYSPISMYHRSIEYTSWVANTSAIFTQHLIYKKYAPIYRIGFNSDIHFGSKYHYYIERIYPNSDVTTPVSESSESPFSKLNVNLVFGSGVAFPLRNQKTVLITVDYLTDLFVLPGYYGNSFKFSIYFPL